MDRRATADLVKSLAADAGFDAVGIAPAEPSRQLAHYRRWIDDGRAGEMAYLTRESAVERRASPTTSLPTGRSVIVVGLNYAQPAAPPVVDRSRGRVAAYASHVDYHTLLVDRLERLAASLRATLGAEFDHRTYVDTGPLLERELAARAGLGWQGKHTCLITPKQGSMLLLGELLVSLDLEPDAPFVADRCGTCTRCLDACPTGAITAPRQLDARRCISYLTIELKGPIPAELRPAVGDWVFGCDVCQDVCPWNRRFARPTDDPALLPPDDRAAPDLAALLALDQSAFSARFRGSPIKRAKRRGLLRNAAVALGNAGDPAALPALYRALADPEPLVRGHAAWAIGRLAPGGDHAGEAAARLAAALAAEADAFARAELAAAIVSVGAEPLDPDEGATSDAQPSVPQPRHLPESPAGP